MSERAEKDLKEICFFLKPLVKKFDLVISVERSGYRLLQILEKDCFDDEINHYPSRSIHLININGKKLLLFDDVITSGERLEKMAELLESQGAIVSTAAFAILKTCDHKPRYYARAVTLKEYEDLCNRISDHMSLLDSPVETDHMQVDGTVEPKISKETLRKSLEPLGELYEGCGSPEMYQLGLRRSKSSIFDDNKIPFIEQEAFTYKLRVKLRENGNLQIIPLSFPILAENTEFCGIQMDPQFCKKYVGTFKNLSNWKMLMCSYCVIYNSSRDLLLDFFKDWEKELNQRGFSFKLGRLTYEDAKFVFNDESLESGITEKLLRILKD